MKLEVITRLPTELVVECKSVCTNWNDIISNNPSFLKMHFDCHHLNHLILLDLFREEEIIRPVLEGIDFESISSIESNILDADFSEAEVLQEIQELGHDKAPGPDGFPIMFFHKCWSFIKSDIMGTMQEFCDTGCIDTKHNSTFITLVPKKGHIETIKDCRPICLLTGVYKILSKVLATRMTLVLPKLISHVQCAYIEGRQITDGTLIANELVDSRSKAEKPGVICKIDLEKAFDRINWSYLEFMLRKMGFSSKWINWTRAANTGLFNGFSMVENGSVVNHLHYADDIIFFVDNSKEELTNLFSILHCFEYIAGLKVNKSKTRLIAIGDVPLMNVWAAEFGCAVDTLPFIYLGMPLGANSKSKEIWVPILEKFDARLSTWKHISLSKGGRLALLKCILTSLPMYYFSLFKASISVIKILEKKMRNFLWGNKRCSHLIKWEMVFADKERGGLGVLNLKFMNIALLAKWSWRFGIEKNSLWYKLIVEKYGCNYSHWVPGPVFSSHGVSCWKTISDLVNNNSSLCIHSGTRVSFWYDKWIGTSSLAIHFNLLCKLDRHQFGSLADHITPDGAWRFYFKRILNNLEATQLAGLLNVIGSNPPVTDTLPDTRRWKLHNSGGFSVKTLYHTFISAAGVDNFPHHFVQKDGVPPKVSFLLWCVVHGKLNSLDMLNRKGMEVYSSCILCGNSNESQDHLLLHCKVAYKTWMAVMPKKHWAWVFPETMRLLKLEMQNRPLKAAPNKVKEDALSNEVLSGLKFVEESLKFDHLIHKDVIRLFTTGEFI
ncbi:uncharacterized protein LOC113330060 [Papaver somniferum]|uniref:uncharacterized protein LOC113330060 n=1 Tax=Papaver somniferum TaxID=3469 RepID=UPI000E7024DA|nr:uncharacterized protein LOC113330060 [Papaver somniferum]